MLEALDAILNFFAMIGLMIAQFIQSMIGLIVMVGMIVPTVFQMLAFAPTLVAMSMTAVLSIALAKLLLGMGGS